MGSFDLSARLQVVFARGQAVLARGDSGFGQFVFLCLSDLWGFLGLKSPFPTEFLLFFCDFFPFVETFPTKCFALLLRFLNV